MDSHQWFQQLRKSLKEQRVPAWYANRLVVELSHHYLDLMEHDKMNGFTALEDHLGERLGSPDVLAIQAADVSRMTWAGRHPWLAFVLGAPLITFGLVICSMLLGALLVLPFAKGRTLVSDPWLGPAMALIGPIQMILPSILACYFLCRMVRRSVRSPWWAVAGCGLVAVVNATTFIHWEPAVSAAGKGMMSLGLGYFPMSITWYQSLVPLIIGVVYANRNLLPKPPLADKPSTPVQMAA